MRAIQLPVTLPDPADQQTQQNVIKQVDKIVANAIACKIFTAEHFDSIKVSQAFASQ